MISKDVQFALGSLMDAQLFRIEPDDQEVSTVGGEQISRLDMRRHANIDISSFTNKTLNEPWRLK